MLAVSKTTSIFKPAKFLHIRAGGHSRRAFSVINLCFFAGGKFESVKLFRLMFTQPSSKAFDAVVGTDKPMFINQVLVDGHVIALQTQLGFDKRTVWLADGGR